MNRFYDMREEECKSTKSSSTFDPFYKHDDLKLGRQPVKLTCHSCKYQGYTNVETDSCTVFNWLGTLKTKQIVT